MNKWNWFCKISAGVGTILLLVWLILYLVGCSFFKHAPTVPPIPEIKTITNTVIQQVKVNDWLVTGSILVMGISVFGFLNGWKQGINAVIAAAVVLGVSLILKAYGGVLIFIGAIGIAGLVGWQIYVRIKALHESVETGEFYKSKITTTDEAKQLIGEEIKKTIQSPTTTKLISAIRKKL